ncbi:MAG: NAD-dependent epimerase/dehydratase family protein [Nitrospirae bacterium]|nr:NAD-dependent epimerase/dehydratase family protein [Nitrospirota bacterium]
MGNSLVVGAGSFIGRHLVDKLIGNGENVSVLVRSTKNLPDAWKGLVNIHICDITEKESMAGVFKGVEVVFHLAARVHDVFEGTNSSKEHLVTNVEGTRNLLDECKGEVIKHFIFFSTIKTMAEKNNDTMDEGFVPAPQTPYGQSKLAAEELVSEYGRKNGFMTTSLRLPMVYGPGNKGNIYRMIEAVDRGRFIMVGRGDNKRSMVFVENVVDAALSVAGEKEADGKVYIVTDGIDYTVRELYETIARGLGKKPIAFHIPLAMARGIARLGDLGKIISGKPLLFDSSVVKRLTSPFTFSSGRIQKEIGFKPKYNLYNTAEKTINWYRENKKYSSQSRWRPDALA